MLSFSFNNYLKKRTIICTKWILNVLDCYYAVCLKCFVEALFSCLFLTVTVSEGEIEHCPSLLTGALIPAWEPGVQPRRLSETRVSSAGLAWPWCSSNAGSNCGSQNLPALCSECSQYEKAGVLLKASSQTKKLPDYSKTALFVFWCRWWCQHSSDSSGDFFCLGGILGKQKYKAFF